MVRFRKRVIACAFLIFAPAVLVGAVPNGTQQAQGFLEQNALTIAVIVIVLGFIGALFSPILIRYAANAAVEKKIGDGIVKDATIGGIQREVLEIKGLQKEVSELKIKIEQLEASQTELKGTYLNAFSQMIKSIDNWSTKHDDLRNEIHAANLDIKEIKTALSYLQNFIIQGGPK